MPDMSTDFRLYGLAISDAVDSVGGLRAWQAIGGTFRGALVAKHILTIVAGLDESTPDDRARYLTRRLFDRLTADGSLR